MAAAAAPKVRYAPPDPTLPKPWKGLIDGATGYLYFWNPETKVTTYERPAADPQPPPPQPDIDNCSGGFDVGGSINNGDQSHQTQGDARAQLTEVPTDHQSAPASMAYGEENGRKHDMTVVNQGNARDNDSQFTDTVSKVKHETSEMLTGQQSAPASMAYGDEYGCKQDLAVVDQGTTADCSSQFPDGTGKVMHEPAGIPGSHQSAPVSKASGEEYRRMHEITIVGGNAPLPYTSFEAAGFPAEILREIRRVGFAAPSPIQAQSWPIALESRDIVAVAKTGSGKTLGYLLPGFIHLKKVRNDSKIGPTILVLSPTRELATQIEAEAEKFGSSSGISCTCLYGGAPKGPQLRDLSRGVDVVVATPGRLNDILEMKRVSLHQVSYLVLDEADRMLDMGFEPQIRKIVNEIPPRRQTLMFTATWPKEVRKIAADLLNNPVQVNVGNVDQLVANKAITQYVEIIPPMEKQRRLEQILMSHEMGSRIIVFCSTKRMCDQLTRSLNRRGGAAAIHGDKSQEERDSVLGQFRTGRSPILVATDVAARGLDVKDIRVVVNYDFPTGIEDYVHRIGRTGRGGATGSAYTFFCEQDSKYAADLVKILEGANQRVPPELLDMVSRGGYGGKSRRFSSDSSSRDGRRSGGASGGFNGGGNGADGGGGNGGGVGGFNGGGNGGGGGFNGGGWSGGGSGPSNDRSGNGSGYGERSRSRSPPPSWA